MSQVSQRMPWQDARCAADALVRELQPACERIGIAGSIRRRVVSVGDIEIVAISRVSQRQVSGLLYAEPRSDLHDLTSDLLAKDDRFRSHPRKCWGKFLRRFEFFHAGRWIPVDLSITTPEKWAGMFLIRTGPADFSKKIVTPRRYGGALPDYLVWRACQVWQGGDPQHAEDERELFHLLGLDYIDPFSRSVAWLQRVLRHRSGWFSDSERSSRC